MTIFTNPILSTVLIVSILTYLGAINYLIAYLRRVYTMTWVELGEFELTKPPREFTGLMKWYVAGMRTGGFILFSSQYKAVQDRKLTFLIWLVRSSFASAIVLMLVFTTSGFIQGRP